MCTYLTEKVSITGSGKGPAGWFTVTDASVYFDHPVHAPAEHTLNIDFLNPGKGPSARVAAELTAESARALAKAIELGAPAEEARALAGLGRSQLVGDNAEAARNLREALAIYQRIGTPEARLVQDTLDEHGL